MTYKLKPKKNQYSNTHNEIQSEGNEKNLEYRIIRNNAEYKITFSKSFKCRIGA